MHQQSKVMEQHPLLIQWVCSSGHVRYRKYRSRLNAPTTKITHAYTYTHTYRYGTTNNSMDREGQVAPLCATKKTYTHKHRMTRMTGPDCAVMCNLINTHTGRARAMTVMGWRGGSIIEIPRYSACYAIFLGGRILYQPNLIDVWFCRCRHGNC